MSAVPIPGLPVVASRPPIAIKTNQPWLRSALDSHSAALFGATLPPFQAWKACEVAWALQTSARCGSSTGERMGPPTRAGA